MARAIILIEDNPDGTVRVDMAHDRKGNKPTPATDLACWLYLQTEEDGTIAAPKQGKGKSK